MHRSYYNLLPCQNKVLQMQWDRDAYNKHTEWVRKARPIVDTRPPQTYIHLHLKPKKLQLEEERLAIIERDNRLLLEKMSSIMRKQGRVDNVNNYEAKSLNREKRQRELMKVTRENKTMMERIIRKSTLRGEREWEADWQRNLTYMDSISRYPTSWWEKEKSSAALQPEGGDEEDRHQRSAKQPHPVAAEEASGGGESDHGEQKAPPAGEVHESETAQD